MQMRFLCMVQDRPYLLAHMSQNLQADVAAHTQARWLEAAPLLRGLPPALLIDLSLRLGTRSFSPDEVSIFKSETYCHTNCLNPVF